MRVCHTNFAYVKLNGGLFGVHGIGHLQFPDHRETGDGAVLVLALVLRDGALHGRPIGALVLVVIARHHCSSL